MSARVFLTTSSGRLIFLRTSSRCPMFLLPFLLRDYMACLFLSTTSTFSAGLINTPTGPARAFNESSELFSVFYFLLDLPGWWLNPNPLFRQRDPPHSLFGSFPCPSSVTDQLLGGRGPCGPNFGSTFLRNTFFFYTKPAHPLFFITGPMPSAVVNILVPPILLQFPFYPPPSGPPPPGGQARLKFTFRFFFRSFI